MLSLWLWGKCLVLRSQTKGHAAILICTKHYVNNLWEITKQEWADILPVLKDTVKKVDKIRVYYYQSCNLNLNSTFGATPADHFIMQLNDRGLGCLLLSMFSTPHQSNEKARVTEIAGFTTLTPLKPSINVVVVQYQSKLLVVVMTKIF